MAKQQPSDAPKRFTLKRGRYTLRIKGHLVAAGSNGATEVTYVHGEPVVPKHYDLIPAKDRRLFEPFVEEGTAATETPAEAPADA